MSDNWIVLVPSDPAFLPSQPGQERRAALFRAMAPESDEIRTVTYEGIEFFDCGANFSSVSCPQCVVEISMSWWEKTMSKDHGQQRSIVDKVFGRSPKQAGGFRLQSYRLPCCGAKASLDALVYNWPQAFGRFGLSGMNCNIAKLTEAQVAILGEALGFKLIVIYEHI